MVPQRRMEPGTAHTPKANGTGQSHDACAKALQSLWRLGLTHIEMDDAFQVDSAPWMMPSTPWSRGLPTQRNRDDETDPAEQHAAQPWYVVLENLHLSLYSLRLSRQIEDENRKLQLVHWKHSENLTWVLYRQPQT